MNQRFTAIIEREDETYVALCPQLDIASHGETTLRAANGVKRRLGMTPDTAGIQ